MEYNAKETTYKVEVRRGLGHGNWKDFSKVIFEVSLDNKHYYGDHFFSILAWAKDRFNSIEIIVCDTLQRFNLAFEKGIEKEKALEIARAQGDDWINKSKEYFKSLQLSPKITKWDDWMDYDKDLYQVGYKELSALYELNLSVKKEIDAICDNVWHRRQKKYQLPESSAPHFKEAVFLPYFFEETVLSSIFLPVVGGVSAYPGSLPLFWDHFIEGKFDCLNGFKGHTFINLSLTRK